MHFLWIKLLIRLKNVFQNKRVNLDVPKTVGSDTPIYNDGSREKLRIIIFCEQLIILFILVNVR